MTPIQGQSAPAVAVPPVATIPAPKFSASGGSIEDFAISVGKALLENGVFLVTKSDSKNPSLYATYKLGTGPTEWRKQLELTAEQSKQLPTAHGVPMSIAFSMALLDLTAPVSLEAKTRERRAATAEREVKSATRLSDDALMAELNRRRLASK